MRNTWKFWGKLETGEGVYVKESGELAIERDKRHLEEPKPEELYRIFQRWPGLCGKPKKYQATRETIDARMIATLRSRVLDLEHEAGEIWDAERRFLRSELNTAMEEHKRQESTIDALKTANAEKDRLISGLFDDAVKREREIDCLTMHIRAGQKDGAAHRIREATRQLK